MASRPKTNAPTDAELAAQLHAAGLRRTQPRIAVLRHMRKIDRPLAHAEVAVALERFALDRVSVYRVLLDLARVKILTRADMGDHVWRFEIHDRAHGEKGKHPHFVCITCGNVTCLGGVKLPPQLTSRGKEIGSVTEVLLRGYCKNCG